MLMDRLQVSLTGGQIGAGVATHFAVASAGHQAAFKAFWQGLSNHMPTGVFADVPATGDVIEVETGLLNGVWSGGSQASIQGQIAGAYPAGVGACVTWLTDGIVNGHRVRGRTFVVPLCGANYDANGTLQDATLSLLRGYCSTLLAGVGDDFLIWHRPRGESDGSAHPVTGFRVSDRVSTLRSRR